MLKKHRRKKPVNIYLFYILDYKCYKNLQQNKNKLCLGTIHYHSYQSMILVDKEHGEGNINNKQFSYLESQRMLL